jgi:hypothetical protein
MAKLVGAFKGKDPREVAIAANFYLIMLPAISIAIALSSWALNATLYH